MKWNRSHTAVLILIIGLSFLLSIATYHLFLKESLANYEEVSLEREKQKNIINNQSQFDIKSDISMFQHLPVEQNHKEIFTILESEAEKNNIQLHQLVQTEGTLSKEPPEGVEVSSFTVTLFGESEEEIINFIETMEVNERIFAIREIVITQTGEQAWEASLLLHSFYYPNSKKLKTYIENSPSS